MTTICLGGSERDVSFLIYEEEGEYIAQVNNHKETAKIETFQTLPPAKKWVNKMLNTCCHERNEIDRFSF